MNADPVIFSSTNIDEFLIYESLKSRDLINHLNKNGHVDCIYVSIYAKVLLEN